MSLLLPNRPGLVAPGAAPLVVIVVTGSRDATVNQHGKRIAECLAPYRNKWPAHQVALFHGAARGGDKIAADFATSAGWRVEARPLDWALGKKAGPLRNREMIGEAVGLAQLHQVPLIVLAFPVRGAANKGTRDACSVAWAHSLKTFITWL